MHVQYWYMYSVETGTKQKEKIHSKMSYFSMTRGLVQASQMSRHKDHLLAVGVCGCVWMPTNDFNMSGYTQYLTCTE